MQQRELIRRVQRGRNALTPEGAARVASDRLGPEVQVSDLERLELDVLLSHAPRRGWTMQSAATRSLPPLVEHERRESSRGESMTHDL